MEQWMDYRRRVRVVETLQGTGWIIGVGLGSLGNSSTVSESLANDRPELQLDHQDFFFTFSLLSIFFSACFHLPFFCFISLLLFSFASV